MGTGKKAHLTVEQIAEALQGAGGLQAEAARMLGVNRSAICRRVQKSKVLQGVVEQARETRLDQAESKLAELIEAGSLGAICFYLKCQGKDRGFIERSEITGRDGAPVCTLTDRLQQVAKEGRPPECTCTNGGCKIHKPTN